MLGKPLNTLNAVSCHLGSGGASLCAVVNGQSLDNTMGLTPLQGLVMSTRCGDLDPAVVLRLLEQNNGDGTAVENLLNKKSGVLGMSGMSADIRDVLAPVPEGGPPDPAGTDRAGLPVEVAQIPRGVPGADWPGRCYSVHRHHRRDAAPGAGGHVRRHGVLRRSPRSRAQHGRAALPVDVAAEDSRVRLLVIATNEELAIVRVTYQALTEAGTAVRQGGVA